MNSPPPETEAARILARESEPKGDDGKTLADSGDRDKSQSGEGPLSKEPWRP